jgi:hypothetical protein
LHSGSGRRENRLINDRVRRQRLVERRHSCSGRRHGRSRGRRLAATRWPGRFGTGSIRRRRPMLFGATRADFLVRVGGLVACAVGPAAAIPAAGDGPRPATSRQACSNGRRYHGDDQQGHSDASCQH